MKTVTQFLNVREAAALVGVSASLLNLMRVRGDGPPFIKFGGRVLYDREDLLEYAATRKVRSTAEARRCS
jgi:predicted DNA-binding transcriptional regulator AlpA